MNALIIAAIAIGAIYLLTRKKELEPSPPLPPIVEHGEAVAQSQAIVNEIAQDLAEVQQAEETAGIPEQASATIVAEETAAAAAAEAAATLEAEAIAAAEAAEAQAVAERAELLRKWNEALDITERNLANSRARLNEAIALYNQGLAPIAKINEQIEFVKTYTRNVVVLYSDDNFKGRTGFFPPGDYPDIGNTSVGRDSASSIKVTAYFVAECFDLRNFGGRWQAFDAGNGTRIEIYNLSRQDIGDNAIASLRVRPSIKGLLDKRMEFRQRLDELRFPVTLATSHVNDIAEAALRTAADIRILEVLGARVSKVEGICSALINTAADINERLKAEEAISKVEELEFYETPEVVAPLPEVEPVTVQTEAAGFLFGAVLGELAKLTIHQRELYWQLRDRGYTHEVALRTVTGQVPITIGF